jgi:DNA-binding transcriptional LysR family regulator
MTVAIPQENSKNMQSILANLQTMDWNDLPYFLAVAREGSLAAAARRLGVNHSTVFRRINALEARLAAQLFDRRPEGYTLTPAGERALQIAERAADSIDEFERSLAGQDIRPTGEVRLTAPANIAGAYLAPLLPAFAARHPGIRVNLAVSDTDYDLSRREADLALRATPKPPGHLVGRRVAEIPWMVCAGSAYLRRTGGPARMQDLEDHPLIGADIRVRHVGALDWLMSRYPPDAFVAACDSLNTMAAMAIAGTGVAILPADQVREGLVQLFPMEPAYSAGLWLLTHPDLRGVARVRALSDFLFSSLREDPRLRRATALANRANPPAGFPG